MKKISSSIKLSTAQMDRLTELATEFRAYARTGPTSGQPSWRVMMQAIAEGEITLTRVHESRILK